MNTRRFPLLFLFALIIASLGRTMAQLQPGEEIVYDNSTTYLGSYQPLNTEYGDEITLAGTNRTVTEFSVEYFGVFLAQGDETGRLRIYKNDGVRIRPDAVSPGTVLYDSGIFPINPGFNSRTVTGIAIDVPDSFTWTIEFGGLAETTGDEAGLLFYSPPTIGQSFNDFWERTATGWLLVQTPNVKNNFGVRVIATGATSSHPPPKLTFTSVQRTASGGSELHFLGVPGQSYIIEGSSDLVNWHALGMGAETASGTFQFTDASTAGLALRFYRAVPGVLPVVPDIRITGISRLLTGAYHVQFTGPATANYTVQTSTDLKTWTNAGPASFLGQGTFEFLDLNLVPVVRRFYRAVMVSQ